MPTSEAEIRWCINYMEPLRPVVDDLVLDLLRKTTFAHGDFIRGNDGACRLHPQLTRYVVTTRRVNDQTVRDEEVAA
jgi:CRISPR/Cas system-associated endonuclease Cas1